MHSDKIKTENYKFLNEILVKGNKVKKILASVSLASRNYTINSRVYAERYNRYTYADGLTSTQTVAPNIFLADDEIYGEVEGTGLVFAPGAGVTLRTPTGQGLDAPTGSTFQIKFKSANDALVTIFKAYANPLSATPSLDFPIIAAGATETVATTVSGAAVGDNVNVTGPATLYASTCYIESSWVSGTNAVSIRVKNNGGTSVDLASDVYNIKVFK